MRNRIPFREILERLTDSQQLVLTGIVVGLASGASAFFFEKAIEWIAHRSESGIATLPTTLRIVLTILIPSLGALVAGILTDRYAPEARGHSGNEINRMFGEGRGTVRGRVGWVKFVASAFTIGSGGSAGREGPVIQIGAAVGSKLGQWRKVPPDQLTMLAAAGAAGGLASAFSVPLASVFFVMEVLLKNFANEAFPAVVIASVTGTATARLLAGGVAQWPLVSYDIRLLDYASFFCIGLVCAPLGIGYQKVLHQVEDRFERLNGVPRWLRPAIGGLLVGAIAIALPDIRGGGQSAVIGALTGQAIGWMMAAYAIAKILTTSLTLGSGGSGGTLMPAMFIGSMAGGVLAKAFSYVPWLPTPGGALAVAGLSCVITSAYNAPITGMVMALEITRDYSLLAPVMFACMVTSLISRPIKRRAPEVAA